MNKTLLLSCQGLTKIYREGKLETPVLRGVDLTLAVGEMLAVVGSSGSGKSTLLHLLGALLISFLATLYPAYRAAQIRPAEALRYE